MKYINNGEGIVIYLCKNFYKIIKNLKYDPVMIVGSWPECYFLECRNYNYTIIPENDSLDMTKYDYVQDRMGFCGGLYRDYIRIDYDKKILAKLKLIL